MSNLQDVVSELGKARISLAGSTAALDFLNDEIEEMFGDRRTMLLAQVKEAKASVGVADRS